MRINVLQSKQQRGMDHLVKQNVYLKESAEKLYKQLTQLQETGRQHENQIDTLLKFNEKLLSIIEKQLNGQKLKNSDILSLQPISQKTQVQSDMFQSQFTNVGTKLLMKTSLNINHNPYDRAFKHEPLGAVERQEQFSIDVDNDKQEQGDGQLKMLIKQFKKKIKTSAGLYSVGEIEKKYKQQSEVLSKLAQQSSEAASNLQAKINDFKLSLGETNAKQKLMILLDQLPGQHMTKALLCEFISAIK